MSNAPLHCFGIIRPGGNPHRRNGKVARLPKVLRDNINEMLQDGISYPEIIRKLGKEGEALNKVNLCHWKSGGYQDWLNEQKHSEEVRWREEHTLQIAHESEGSALNEVAIKMATAQIYEVLQEFGTNVLHNALKQNPDNYVRLLNALWRLTNAALTCQQERAQAAEAKATQDKFNLG